MPNSSSRLLDAPEVIRWCYEPITEISLLNSTNVAVLRINQDIEKAWANNILNRTNLKQWTTTLCQNVVREALTKLGRKNVRRTTPRQSSVRDKNYQPDLECDDFVYEVKGRSWCTPGTAGEKMLGTPLKYGEIPRLYNKPLQIILVAYQEYEARKGFAFGDLLDISNQTPELAESLAFFKHQRIEYIAFTDILAQIGLSSGSRSESHPPLLKRE